MTVQIKLTSRRPRRRFFFGIQSNCPQLIPNPTHLTSSSSLVCLSLCFIISIFKKTVQVTFAYHTEMTLKSFFIRLMMMRALNGSGLLPEITHVPLREIIRRIKLLDRGACILLLWCMLVVTGGWWW